MNAIVKSDTPVIAYLDPPNSTGYHTYAEYLQDFRKFLEFLHANGDVASSQTFKRPKQPSIESLHKTIGRVRQRLPESLVKNEELSDSEGTVQSIKTSTIGSFARGSSADTPPGTTDIGCFSDHSESLPDDLKPTPTRAKDVAGCVLMGKKQCKRRLMNFCSEVLATRLIETDNVSRAPLEFESLVKWLQHKQIRKGRKLSLTDVKSKCLDEKGTGRLNSEDFKAIWNSDGPDGDYDWGLY